MNRHATDVVSLVAGAVFLAIAGVWLLYAAVRIDTPPIGWLTAGVLVIIGLLGIAGVLHTGRSAKR